MLQAMRDRLSGIVMIVIIGAIAVTFALWGVQNYRGGTGDANVVAKVNGVKITRDLLNVAYQNLQQATLEKMKKGALLDGEQQNKVRQQALEQLIAAQIQAQAAEALGFYIGPQQIDAAIAQIPAFQVNGKFSPERFQQALGSMLYRNPDRFYQELKNSMLINQMRLGILTSTFALPGEVDETIRLIDQRRDFAYMIIPIYRYEAHIPVSPKMVRDYYQQHEKDFMTPEEVSIRYLTLSANTLKQKLNITDAQIKRYYDDNIDMYSRPAQWQVTRILIPLPQQPDKGALQKAQDQLAGLRKQAMAGKKFEQLSAGQTKTGWLTQTQMSTELARVVVALKSGQVSQPFQTPEGFNLVKLLAVKKRQVMPFEKMQKQVKEAVTQQKLQKLFSDASDRLADLTYTNSDNLTTAAKALNLKIQSTPMFTRQGFTRKGTDKGITSDQKIISAAFSDAVLNQSYNSDPVKLDSDTQVVLRVKDHTPSKLRPLQEVQASIEEQLKAEGAKAKVVTKGEGIVKQLKANHAAMAEVSKQNELVWHRQNKAGRKTTGMDAEIIKTAFSLKSPEPHTSSFGGEALKSGDYVVIAVSNVYDGRPASLSSAQRKAYVMQLRQSLGQLEYGLYMQERQHKAKVKRFLNKQ